MDAIILIVDDEIGVTRLTQRLLERAGYQVVAVNRPHDGIEYLESEQVDLMLVDIRMPEMDGFRLMEIARGIQPEIAVVIMTGYGTVDTAVESLRKGADGMVLKPFTGADLVQSIEQALRERRNQREIQRLRVLRPLFDITEALISEKDPDRLKDLIISVVYEHLQCSHFSLYQHEQGAYALLIQNGDPLEADVRPLLDRAVLTEEPLIVSVHKQADSKCRSILEKNGLGSVICVPDTSGSWFNAMLAGRTDKEYPFSNADLEMLVLFSRQAAIALENAELYFELQEHVRQIEESQQALIQAEKMAAVGRLTASIAHEINNPLQAVRNCLHIIEHGNLSDESGNSYVELVNEELDRLMNAVKRMLDYYRPGMLQRYLAPINDIVVRALQLIEKQLTRRGIRVEARLGEGLPDVMVVENQVQQAIFNIVLNAMEAMPDGGDLVVETELRDNQVIIRIADTGSGIPPEDREKIFEPFVSTKDDGLGLGLSVSYGIMTAHGGTIELLPDSGEGTTFQLALPVGVQI